MKTNEATTADEAAPVAEQGALVAPEKATAKKGASRKKSAPKAKKTAKPAAAKKGTKATRPARAPKAAKEERVTKKDQVVELMRRAKGATLAEIVETTGWMKHTTRGFISLLGSKAGLQIESAKNAAGERTYRLAK